LKLLRTSLIALCVLGIPVYFLAAKTQPKAQQAIKAQIQGKTRPMVTLRGSTMGTYFMIKLFNPPEMLHIPNLQKKVEQELATINQQMSTYIEDSELSVFNKSKKLNKEVSVSLATATVVKRAKEISVLTGGAFDMTVGRLVNMWGFGPEDYPQIVPSSLEIDNQLKLTGYDKVKVKLKPASLSKSEASVYVDLSGIAKGYGVDRISQVLSNESLDHHMVDIGGEIRAKGTKGAKPWTAAVERPQEGVRGTIWTVVKLNNAAIATSGSYRNYFEKDGQRYSHIIDPRNGKPITHHLVSVTVISENSMDSDALATSLYVMGEEEGKRLAEKENLAVMLISKNGDDFKEWQSKEFAKFVMQKSS
jgi:thiamine biosynthesis lipoprotein